MNIFNKEGKKMPHPDQVKDAGNDTMTSAIEYENYLMDYQEMKEFKEKLILKIEGYLLYSDEVKRFAFNRDEISLILTHLKTQEDV